MRENDNDETDDFVQITLNEYPPDETRHQDPVEDSESKEVSRGDQIRRQLIELEKSKEKPKPIIELRNISRALDLPRDTMFLAESLFRAASRTVSYRPHLPLAGAAVYAACRVHKTPRPLSSIAKHARSSRKKIAKSFRELISSIEREIPPYDELDVAKRICEMTEVSEDIQKKVLDMTSKLKTERFGEGKDPWGLCAAVFYIVSFQHDLGFTQRQVAEVAEITEVTVRNRYQEIIRELEIE